MNKKPNRFVQLLSGEQGIILGISFGIFLFIIFFQPFPLERFDFNNRILFIAGLTGIVFIFLFLLRIIFPLIMPSITIITILTFTGSLNVFEQIYVMTGVDGGPYYATDTLGTLFYRTAFGDITSSLPNIGIGSAIGFVLYLLTFATSVTAALLLRRREVEL